MTSILKIFVENALNGNLKIVYDGICTVNYCRHSVAFLSAGLFYVLFACINGCFAHMCKDYISLYMQTINKRNEPKLVKYRLNRIHWHVLNPAKIAFEEHTSSLLSQ